MATYSEIYDLRRNSELKNKVVVACMIAAETIRLESDQTGNHANRLKWAKQVFESAESYGEKLLLAILANHAASSVEEINNISDESIQSAVNKMVNIFAIG